MKPSTQSLPGIRLSRTTVVLSGGGGGCGGFGGGGAQRVKTILTRTVNYTQLYTRKASSPCYNM